MCVEIKVSLCLGRSHCLGGGKGTLWNKGERRSREDSCMPGMEPHHPDWNRGTEVTTMWRPMPSAAAPPVWATQKEETPNPPPGVPRRRQCSGPQRHPHILKEKRSGSDNFRKTEMEPIYPWYDWTYKECTKKPLEVVGRIGNKNKGKQIKSGPLLTAGKDKKKKKTQESKNNYGYTTVLGPNTTDIGTQCKHRMVR